MLACNDSTDNIGLNNTHVSGDNLNKTVGNDSKIKRLQMTASRMRLSRGGKEGTQGSQKLHCTTANEAITSTRSLLLRTNRGYRPLGSTSRTDSSVTFDFSNLCTKERCLSIPEGEVLRSHIRMSAPEFPPILFQKRTSPVQQTTSTLRLHVQRFSRQSESSLGVYPSKSLHSSSASNHSQHFSPAPIASELQAKYLTRIKTWSADQPTREASEKFESIAASKNGMNISSTMLSLSSDRTSRLSSREQSSSSGNDVKKTIKNSESESQIAKLEPRFISRSRTTMKRNSSDHKLTEMKKKYHKNYVSNGKISIEKTEALTGSMYNSGNINGMRRYSSTLAISQERRNGTESEEQSKKSDVEDDVENDGEKTQRIVDWIIGVDRAEPPPEQDIYYAEEPPQTDTAVHIVYEGD